jgi:ribonuclease Z
VYHRGPDCYGFVFEEKAHRPFLPEKAEALGVPPGPLRRELVNGDPVTLPTGAIVQPEQVLGETVPGAKYVHVGDTGRTEEILEHARNADALVIEATYLEEERQMAKEFAHLTARQAGELAKAANVGQLILTHVSRRYRESDVLAEAQTVFPRVAVARDFDAWQIKRGEAGKVEN